MNLTIPPCLWCKHLRQNGRSAVWTCAAFGEGIPEFFVNGEVIHTQPYPGDHGIQFEPKPGYDVKGRKVDA